MLSSVLEEGSIVRRGMINVSSLDCLTVPIITIMICPHPYSHITQKKHHKGGRGEEGGGEEKSADDAMKQIWMVTTSKQHCQVQ